MSKTLLSNTMVARPNRHSVYEDDFLDKTVTLPEARQQARLKSQNQLRQTTGALIAKDSASQYSYVGKSKVIYSRGMQKRADTN